MAMTQSILRQKPLQRRIDGPRRAREWPPSSPRSQGVGARVSRHVVVIAHLSLLGLFFVTMVACSSPTTPRRRRIMSSTMILLSSLSYYYSPYFQCDAFTGMITTTTSNRQGIIALVCPSPQFSFGGII